MINYHTFTTATIIEHPMAPQENHSEPSDEQSQQAFKIVMLYSTIIFMIFTMNSLLILIPNGMNKEIISQETYLRGYSSNIIPLVCNKTQYINEITCIEKKIAFYDIRQHHVNVDLRHPYISRLTVMDTFWETVMFSHNRDGTFPKDKAKLMIEYLTRLNQVNTSIFDKKADELLIYTKDIYNGDRGDPIDIIGYRNDNDGYTIDSVFIEEVALNTKDKSFEKTPIEIHRYERELMEIAYNLHNTFYKKLKVQYQQIEDKYNSLPHDFTEFDELMNEVREKGKEIDILEEFDSKRRKLQIRDMILIFDL